MVFNVINNQFGLFQFLKRYGQAIQVLIEEINGFTTKVSGIYNPVNFPNRWRNIRREAYTLEPFDFDIKFPLTVTAKQTGGKNFNIDVIKRMLPRKFIEKLQISKELLGKFTDTLTLSKSFKIDYISPLDVMPWVIHDVTPRHRGIWIPRKVNITDDVGTISEIEMLDIIGNIEEVEIINAI